MQFNFVFKDASGRIKYNGNDVSKLSDTITQSVTLTKAQANDLAKFAYAQWKDIINASHPDVSASSSPWRSRDYRADLLAGISKSVSGTGVSFKIEGDKALAAEFGWGVPYSPEWHDGIGQYAGGALQDTRPWLLHPASPHVHDVKLPLIERSLGREGPGISNSGARRYRVLRFDAPELSTIIDLTAEADTERKVVKKFFEEQQAVTDEEHRAMRAASVKQLTHTARSRLDTDKNGNLVFKPLSYSDIDPAGMHLHWVYHRATLASTQLLKGLKDTKNDRRLAMNLIMQKAKFTVFRTITDSFIQKTRHAFFTKGIAPAHTLMELKHHIIPQALANMLAGKPLGSV
jgi:hypothetical protein